MTERVYNFSAGPAVLPVSVLERVAGDLVSLPGVGSSILEVSHRGPVFTEYMERAREGLRNILEIPSDYEVLFLQGGSRLQFAMIPMNFLSQKAPAGYIVSGSWGKQAFEEAAKQGPAECVWSGETGGFADLPEAPFDQSGSGLSYLYYVSNETIQGVQFKSEPSHAAETPLICDASSDFLHKKIDVSRYGMVYACAQKNAGPAGLTIVVIRKDLMERANTDLPGYLDFRSHARGKSLFNTPPTFAIYVFALVLEWLRDEIGGLDKMYKLNQQKAELVYRVIDQFPEVFEGHAGLGCRSVMNAVFRFRKEDQLGRFLAEAEKQKLMGLAGHRSVGGVRASLYNAMPMEGVQCLADFMTDFAEKEST